MFYTRYTPELYNYIKSIYKCSDYRVPNMICLFEDGSCGAGVAADLSGAITAGEFVDKILSEEFKYLEAAILNMPTRLIRPKSVSLIADFIRNNLSKIAVAAKLKADMEIQ